MRGEARARVRAAADAQHASSYQAREERRARASRYARAPGSATQPHNATDGGRAARALRRELLPTRAHARRGEREARRRGASAAERCKQVTANDPRRGLKRWLLELPQSAHLPINPIQLRKHQKASRNERKADAAPHGGGVSSSRRGAGAEFIILCARARRHSLALARYIILKTGYNAVIAGLSLTSVSKVKQLATVISVSCAYSETVDTNVSSSVSRDKLVRSLHRCGKL